MKIVYENELTVLIETDYDTLLISKEPPAQYNRAYVIGSQVSAFNGSAMPIYNLSKTGQAVIKFLGDTIQPRMMAT